LRFDTQAFEQDPLKNEGAWQDKYDLFMHALNFYLFLLIQDKQEDDLVRGVAHLDGEANPRKADQF
jgi:hypothetical protein